jgi:hypothetical protein
MLVDCLWIVCGLERLERLERLGQRAKSLWLVAGESGCWCRATSSMRTWWLELRNEPQCPLSSVSMGFLFAHFQIVPIIREIGRRHSRTRHASIDRTTTSFHPHDAKRCFIHRAGGDLQEPTPSGEQGVESMKMELLLTRLCIGKFVQVKTTLTEYIPQGSIISLSSIDISKHKSLSRKKKKKKNSDSVVIEALLPVTRRGREKEGKKKKKKKKKRKAFCFLFPEP